MQAFVSRDASLSASVHHCRAPGLVSVEIFAIAAMVACGPIFVIAAMVACGGRMHFNKNDMHYRKIEIKPTMVACVL